MMFRITIICALLYMSTSCSQPQDYSQPLYDELDVQGHRGCRGSFPENSVAGFIQALEWGATTLEMDVVISKDHQVLLSHEPFMSSKICLDEAGSELDSIARFKYNIYKMDYQEIQRYDCGSKTPVGFQDQIPVPGPKPLLKDVIRAVEKRRAQLGLPPVNYNIETKSQSGTDQIFHPIPKKFVELVLAVTEKEGILEKTIIQSFDIRTLQEVRAQNPSIRTSLLINNNREPLYNFIQLGFEPTIYSPEYHLVTDSLVIYLHQKHIAVIPWTVNDTANMSACIKMGVDGIITDYPEVLLTKIGRLKSID